MSLIRLQCLYHCRDDAGYCGRISVSSAGGHAMQEVACVKAAGARVQVSSVVVHETVGVVYLPN